jgi:hypothetical protein
MLVEPYDRQKPEFAPLVEQHNMQIGALQQNYCAARLAWRRGCAAPKLGHAQE